MHFSYMQLHQLSNILKNEKSMLIVRYYRRLLLPILSQIIAFCALTIHYFVPRIPSSLTNKAYVCLKILLVICLI